MCMFMMSFVRSRNMSKRGESFGIGRIGSKIKGVFRSTTMEGALLPPSSMTDIDDDVVSDSRATVVVFLGLM